MACSMNVLSLFDGMSCGQIALDRLGIKVDNYFACEIDKYAMQVTQANFPNTIQLGDVTKVDFSKLPKIDLVLAGSPCQGFSFAGKQLAFDDPRSALFFEFIKILKEVKPKYFLLENVRMKKEFLNIITEQVSSCYPEIPFGIEPILINSSLVSAQSRQRYYWTNIPNIKQPEERGIVLRDILEESPNEAPTKDTARNRRHHKGLDDKSLCMTATMYKGAGNNGMTLVPQKPIKVGMNIEQVKVRKHEVDIVGLQYLLREMKSNSGKTNKRIAEETNMPLTKVEHWFRTDSSFAIPSDDVWFKLKEVLGIQTEVFDAQIMEFEYRDGVYETKQRVYSEDGKAPTLTASNKEQYIETYDSPQQVGTAVDINGHDILKRVYSPNGKSPTVNTCQGGNREPKVVCGRYVGRYKIDGVRQDHKGSIAGKSKQMLELRKDEKTNNLSTVQKDNVLTKDNTYWRKLTPLEAERLQTVPDNYTNHVSNTQRYKMLGNGWTVEVICHIFKNMEVN
jgi:DNA-cytosine methyltransferase